MSEESHGQRSLAGHSPCVHKELDTTEHTRLPLTSLFLDREGNGTHSSTLVWRIPWTEEPGRLHSPWGCEKLDTTERLHFHFPLSRIGEGNGNPLQCSCLENPRDRGAWWAALYGVAQSWTLLRRLSSSGGYFLNLFLCNIFPQLKSRHKFLSFF